MRAATALVLLALASCQTPADSFSLPPGPPATDAQPPTPIGHWLLEGSPTGEHLWIESNGTFTEAGGVPDRARSLLGVLSSGTWTWSAPTLTLDDTPTGATVIGYVTSDAILQVRSASTSYRFALEASDADAGAD